MSYSPLESSFGKQQKSKNKKLITLIGLVVVGGIGGGVFAANISIATGAIEFGQGVASATACDSTITVVPDATFVTDKFLVSKVVLEGVDSSGSGCNGKTLTLTAVNSAGTEIGSIATVVPSGAASVDITVTPTPSVTSSVLAKFLLESN